jgi:hypothetical protein
MVPHGGAKLNLRRRRIKRTRRILFSHEKARRDTKTKELGALSRITSTCGLKPRGPAGFASIRVHSRFKTNLDGGCLEPSALFVVPHGGAKLRRRKIKRTRKILFSHEKAQRDTKTKELGALSRITPTRGLKPRAPAGFASIRVHSRFKQTWTEQVS